jgi:hypothetical protein
VFKAKRASIVDLIMAAHRASGKGPMDKPSPQVRFSDGDTATPPLPPQTGLQNLAERGTLMGASRAAYTDRHQPPDPSTPATDPTPSDNVAHRGPFHHLPNRSARPPPVNPYRPDPWNTHARYDNDYACYGGAHTPHDYHPPHYGGAHTPHDHHPPDSHDHAHSPSSGPCSPHGSVSSNDYHRGQHGIPDDCNMSTFFLANLGFHNEHMQYKIMCIFRQICQGWYNRQQNSFGPQKESILKSTTFSTRLLLEKFDAPSVVHWYECLTSTCEAFRIGLVPFNAIQFGCRHEGLCIPGLGLDHYRDMQSALCTALPLCLVRADSRALAMIAGIETKS